VIKDPQMQKQASAKILVVGPSWVGDMVMAQSLFITLSQEYDTAVIDVLAPEWSLPILARMPQVRAGISMPFKHGELKIWQRILFAKRLRDEAYDIAIILPNSFKSAFIPLFAKIPRRVGWRGEMRNLVLTDCRTLDKNQFPLMVERFAALGKAKGSELLSKPPRPALTVNKDEVKQVKIKFGLDNSSNSLVICPGAEFGDAKRWPVEHFAKLTNNLLQQGWQVWIVGSGKDTVIAQDIVSELSETVRSQCNNLTGRTSLGEVVDILSAATAVVSNDSGLMHIAAALNKPIVALYGSTSADFTPPLADNVKLLSTDIQCRPCFQRQCPLQHKRCLTEISVDWVTSSLNEVLASSAAEGVQILASSHS